MGPPRGPRPLAAAGGWAAALLAAVVVCGGRPPLGRLVVAMTLPTHSASTITRWLPAAPDGVVTGAALQHLHPRGRHSGPPHRRPPAPPAPARPLPPPKPGLLLCLGVALAALGAALLTRGPPPRPATVMCATIGQKAAGDGSAQEKPIITVDGDAGGGQILRNGFALAALAQQPLRVLNIRGARTPPGLRPQHLQGIQMVADLCQGRLEGDRQWSTDCSLWPAEFRGGNFTVDTGTAGSCTLLAQISLPCQLFTPTPTVFRGKGGTDVSFSPPIDEMCGVLMPLLTRFGIDAKLELVRRGFYPRGGGEFTLAVDHPRTGTALTPITLLDPGKVVRVEGRAFAAGNREAQDLGPMISAAKSQLRRLFPSTPVDIEPVLETPQTAAGYGSAITLIAITDTGCRFGATHFRDPKKPLPPAQCGEQAADFLAGEVGAGACVDCHTQDQLLIFMALAAGRSEVRVGPLTDHTKCAIPTVESLLPCRFSVEADGPANVIRCDGVGLVSPGVYTTAVAEGPKVTELTVANPPPPAADAEPTPAAGKGRGQGGSGQGKGQGKGKGGLGKGKGKGPGGYG